MRSRILHRRSWTSFRPGLIVCITLLVTMGLADTGWTNEAGEISLARGTKLFLDGKYNEAKEQFNQGLKADPENAEIWTALGTVNLSLKDYAAAKEALTKAIVLDPEVPRGKMYLGVTCYFQDNFGEAKRLLREAKAQNPKDAMVHYYLALLASREQRPQEALQSLEIGISLDPVRSATFRSAVQATQAPEVRPYGISVTSGIEYDDNVKVLPDNISVTAQRGFAGPYKGHKADWRTPIIVRAYYEPLQTPTTSIGVRYYGYTGLNYYLDNFNNYEQYGELYLKYQVSRLTINPFYVFDYNWVGGQPWSMFNNAGLRLTLQETPVLTGDLVYMFKAQDYKWLRSYGLPSQIRRGGYVNQLGLFQTLRYKKGSLRAGFYWEREVSGPNWTQNVFHFPIEGIMDLPWQVSAYGYFEYAYGPYSNDDYIYAKRRQDQLFTVIAQLRRPINSWTTAVLMYTHANNDGCNIPDYRYHRNIYSLLLQLHY